jgi:hypothetical protein
MVGDTLRQNRQNRQKLGEKVLLGAGWGMKLYSTDTLSGFTLRRPRPRSMELLRLTGAPHRGDGSLSG